MPPSPSLHGPVDTATLLSGVESAYLIGMGGVGLGAAAHLLRARGVKVRGSDRDPAAGVEPDTAPLPEDLDLVVHSAAIPPDHPQRAEATRRGLRIGRYAELLGALMSDRDGVCVAGSHGKTTTSALIASALLRAGRDPSFVVGGRILGHGSGARAGGGRHFVAESCEFDRSFHAHAPWVAIVTNVDEDHLDYYADLAEIQEAFRVFAALLPEDGTLVVNDAYAPVFDGDGRIRAQQVTYGFGEDAAWRVVDPRPDPQGPGMAFGIRHEGASLGTFTVPLLGRHNVLNACGAAAVLFACGLGSEAVREGLAAFEGVGRRLELVTGDRGSVTLFDDYGHHPAEIRAVIRALRKRFDGRRLVVIFQPHQASRTRCLLKEFAAALADADVVWLPPIYFARDSEEERRRVTSDDLARRIRNEGGEAHTLPDLDAVVDHGARALRPGDVVVTMGAGNIDEVARGLAARL